MKSAKVLLFAFILCLGTSGAFAQKVLLPDGSVFVEQQEQNLYKKAANGYIYRFAADGTVWVTVSAESGSRTFEAASIKHGDGGRIFFYDKVSDEYMGSFEPSTNNFVLPKGDVIARYTTGSELVSGAGNPLYRIDGTLTNEVVGFFVYFSY